MDDSDNLDSSSTSTDDPFTRLMSARGVAVPAIPTPAATAASPAGDPFSRLMVARGVASAPVAPAVAPAAMPAGSTITYDPGDGKGLRIGTVTGTGKTGGAILDDGSIVGPALIKSVKAPAPQTTAPTGAAPIAALPGSFDPMSGFPPGMGLATSDIDAAGAGLARGVMDVTGTLAKLPGPVSWSDPSTAASLATMRQNKLAQYTRQYGNNPLATVGRGVGNMGAVAPLMAAGGAVAAPIAEGISAAAPAVAPLIDFATGASRGNKLYQLISRGVLGAEQGATAGTLTSSGNPDQSVLSQAEQGAVAGGILGAALPAAGGALRAGYNALTGGGVSPEVAALAQRANDLGIAIRGGQISNSPMVRATDSVLPRIPFTGYAALNDAQRTQFTRAVANTFGEKADALTQDVMQRAKSRIGQAFDSVAARTTIDAPSASQMVNDLAGIESDASQVLSGGEFQPIKTQLSNIVGKVSSAGTIDGDTYQALTRKGAPLDRAMSSSDPNVRFYAGRIRGALDDALERSAPADVLDDLRTARKQWKNMRTVEDLVEKSPTGQISPLLLLNKVRQSYPNFAYTGAGDLGDLAKIGQQFLKEVLNSGTPERAAIYALIGGGGAEGAAALLGHPGAAAVSAAGALGTGLVARGVGAALNSAAYRNRLIRSAVPTGPGATTRLSNALAPYIAPAGAIAVNRLRQYNSAAPALP